MQSIADLVAKFYPGSEQEDSADELETALKWSLSRFVIPPMTTAEILADAFAQALPVALGRPSGSPPFPTGPVPFPGGPIISRPAKKR